MAEPVHAAFVGCTHPHIFPRIQLLQQASDVKIIGCYDPDVELAAAIEARSGVAAFDSVEQLLDEPGVNLVVIEGWDTDNPGYVAQAAGRGHAILLEKPGAPDLEGMRAVVDTVRAHEIPFQVGYMLRFSPALDHILRFLEEELLGIITLARFHAAAPVGGAAEVWQSVPGDMGGVVFTDGCHMVDVIIRLLGIPRTAKGMMLGLPQGDPVLAHGFKAETLSELDVTVEMPMGNLMYEDAGVALLGYDDKLAVFDVTGWEAHPWVEAWRIELYGTDGVLHAGLNPPWYRLYLRNPKGGYEPGWHSWEVTGDLGVGNSLVVDVPYTREMEQVLRRVREWDTDNEVWLREAEGVVAILDAIYRSAQEGQAMAVRMR